MIYIDIPASDRVAAELKGGPEKKFFELVDGLTYYEGPEEYPKSVFLLKGRIPYIEITENKYVWFDQESIWSPVSEMLGFDYGNTRKFFKRMVERYFKVYSNPHHLNHEPMDPDYLRPMTDVRVMGVSLRSAI